MSFTFKIFVGFTMAIADRSTHEHRANLNSLEPVPALKAPNWKNPGHIRIDRAHFYALARRCTDLMFKMAWFIEDRTRSYPGAPEFGEITMDEWRSLTGATDRTIELNLKKLEAAKFMVRQNPDRRYDRGGYRLCYDQFEATELPPPRKHRCRPIEARVEAPLPVAALRANLNSLPPEAPAAKGNSLPANSDAIEAAKQCARPGGCPLLSLAVSIEQSVRQSLVPVREDRRTDKPDSRYAELEVMVDLLRQRIGSEEGPRDSLIPGIVANLSGAPLTRFRKRALMRMKKGDSLGKLLYVATDVGTVWLVEQRKSQAKAMEEEARLVEAWQEIITNPNEPDDVKQQSRELLRAHGVKLNE